MSCDVEAIVVGAGVVGLAIARALARDGFAVLTLEAENAIGHHSSSRNSEVIHAGLYYPPGGLKARLCVEGRRKLYDYCSASGVAAQKIGKLIVAASADQFEKLEVLRQRGVANGVENLQMLSGEEALRLEPELRCAGALWSPETGIVDSHALMLALQGEAENLSAQFAFNAAVETIAPDDAGFSVTAGGTQLRCRFLVNAAGHGAPLLARNIRNMPQNIVPQNFYARGDYYAVSGRAPFKRLIYPLPVAGGLGVHVTLDLGGGMRLGPDVAWINRLDYRPGGGKEESFRDAVAPFWPGLREREMSCSFCGVRPKIVGADAPDADFRIDGPEIHGFTGLINLFGIESPGLTASLALADHVAARLRPMKNGG